MKTTKPHTTKTGAGLQPAEGTMKLNTSRTILTGHPRHDLVVTTNNKTAGIWIINTQTGRNHGAKDLTDHELTQILNALNIIKWELQTAPRERYLTPVPNKLELTSDGQTWGIAVGDTELHHYLHGLTSTTLELLIETIETHTIP